MSRVRRATADDATFLGEMLAIAADWRPGAPVRPVVDVLSDRELARYVAGWPADGDVGFVAEDEWLLGAAWWRFFSEHDPGYGFVDESAPELAIGVVEAARGRGVGTLLHRALVDEARQQYLPALSLSVEPDNPATSLYERLGFETVSRVGGALTMVLEL